MGIYIPFFKLFTVPQVSPERGNVDHPYDGHGPPLGRGEAKSCRRITLSGLTLLSDPNTFPLKHEEPYRRQSQSSGKRNGFIFSRIGCVIGENDFDLFCDVVPERNYSATPARPSCKGGSLIREGIVSGAATTTGSRGGAAK
jgi:hypothetical protein